MSRIDLLAENVSALEGGQYEHVLTLCAQDPQALRPEGYIVVGPVAPTQRGRMYRSEIGSGPRSVCDVLGISEYLIDWIVTRLTPRCSQCDCDALPPKTLSSYQLPLEGFIALAVTDSESDISLRERLELLGVERAYVHGRLVSLADLTYDEGEPILGVLAARDINGLSEIVTHWFTRGGGELRVLHLSSRASVAVEIGTIHALWSCPGCKQSLPAATRAMLQEAPSCATCRGEGWIAGGDTDDGRRWLACRDCDALGFSGGYSGYRFFGLRLSQILALTCNEVGKLMREGNDGNDEVSRPIKMLLAEVCAAGLGDYPLGAAYDLCSPGERMLISVAQMRLAKVRGVGCLLDGAHSDLSEAVSQSSASEGLPVAVLGIKPRKTFSNRFEAPADASTIVLRDVYHGVLHIDEVRFPHGAVTAICGHQGTGKSLLLEIIARRFAQRRKRAHVASFGAVQRCWYTHALRESGDTLLTLLDFSGILAAEIARTRRAKELGILASDLEGTRSKYRCEECRGGELGTRGVECSTCQGALYDWRVADLPLLGSRVRGIVQAPIAEIASRLWGDACAEAVLRMVVEIGAGQLSLGTRFDVISPVLRRVLKISTLLAKVAASSSTHKGRSEPRDCSTQLVLLDGPRVLPSHYEEYLGGWLHTLSQRGATILYAGMPQGLESSCQSVIQLKGITKSVIERSSSQYLDVRFARESCAG